jgi:acetyltransferase-like isoleucine patch superfamily enzyme
MEKIVEGGMKHKIMKFIGLPVIFLVKAIRPFKYAWKRIYFTSRLAGEISDMDFSVECDGRVHVSGTRNIHLGKRCRLGMDTELRTIENGKIHLGDDTRLNRGGTLTSYSEIFIDDFTIIGEFVSIRDANHGMERGEPIRYQPHTSKPIRIGKDVWIARGSCILAGVTIGEGSVIGANSVVTKDIPPYSIAAGVPARIIKSRE